MGALGLMSIVFAPSIAGCSSSGSSSNSGNATAAGAYAIDNAAWNYDSDNDIYWQAGLTYCTNPANSNLESYGIYVPGAYMNAKKGAGDTYTCEVANGNCGDFTSANAPYVFPVDTPGYSSQAAPSGMDSQAVAYCSQGFIYVSAGCRGREAGAPAGVTDLKAAIRAVRANASTLPGNQDSFFSFGMSGGGAQSALLGATGDSAAYDPYLNEIGACMDCSDALAGSMCWCPITGLDVADGAYEWNMGLTRSDLSAEDLDISKGLAASFAEQLNSMKLKDAKGNTLALEPTDDGYYQAGSYYDYVLEQLDASLAAFIENTQFPYTPSSGMGMIGERGGAGRAEGAIGDGDFTGGDFAGGDLPDGDFAGGKQLGDKQLGGDLPDGDLPDGDLPDGDLAGDKQLRGGFTGGTLPSGEAASAGSSQGTTDKTEAEIYAEDGVSRIDSSQTTDTNTYETLADYIDSLNADSPWISYDQSTNTAKVTSLEGFAKACKQASKTLGAFDALDLSQAENTLFGVNGDPGHFDTALAALVAGTEYEAAFKTDLAKTDSAGNTVETRVNIYTPLWYLLEGSAGQGTSQVAQHWRIRTGANQGDTALATEINLALALQEAGNDVDFGMVWGQGHTKAEVTGTSDDNFIEWVKGCLSQ